MEVLVGDVAAHSKNNHEGAEHGYCAARPDHIGTHRGIAMTTLYIYRVSQKKRGISKTWPYLEIHQKGKKWLCFGKFNLNAAG